MKKSLLIATTMLFAGSVYAGPVTFFDTIAAGEASFNSTVTGTGAAVATDTLSGLGTGSSWNRGDYTISTTNGGSKSITSANIDVSSGQMIGINPSQRHTDQSLSGITFTFLNPINAIGFEVGDWATCCFDPTSDLYIAFDGGATQLVASASTGLDNPTFAAAGSTGGPASTVFIGAIDDTATFSSVVFWGTGYGEFLTAGGKISYSTVDIGSVGAVPVPAALFMFAPALLGFFGLRRKVNNVA